MRRRHLESVSAALYGSTFQHLLKSPIRIQPQLSGKGVLGHSPKCVLPTFAHKNFDYPEKPLKYKHIRRISD